MALTKLTQNLIDGTLVTSVNSLTGAVTLETGTDWVNTIQTSNFTAVAGKGYFVNTTSGEITVTLPAGAVGNEIIIQDYAGTFATNNLIMNANGSEKIQGSLQPFKITTDNATCSLIYQDATKGWNADNITEIPPQGVVEYLVIAGGGSGGTQAGGGGGAGGLRTSYGSTTGGGGSSETAPTLIGATNYAITIGAGGPGGWTNGVNGNNTTFNTIVATGGGVGGYYNDAGAGGSGGGANSYNNGSYNATGGLAVTSPVVQGYRGGNTGPYAGGSQIGSAGGGGASAQGADVATSASGPTAGGAGLSVSITGSAVTYAGGGGAGNIGGGSAGGAGGGGAGSNCPSCQGTDGTANTGGGGGGSGYQGGIYGGDGGSGVVILRYPNTLDVSNPGGGVTFSTVNVGSDRVTTITAGTGNIQF